MWRPLLTGSKRMACSAQWDLLDTPCSYCCVSVRDNDGCRIEFLMSVDDCLRIRSVRLGCCCCCMSCCWHFIIPCSATGWKSLNGYKVRRYGVKPRNLQLTFNSARVLPPCDRPSSSFVVAVH